MNIISLKCKSCGAALNIDEDREIMCCPFCGSKEIFEESDDVKKTRIRSKAYRDVTLGSKEIERQMQLDNAQIKINEEKRGLALTKKVFIVLGAILLIEFIVLGLSSGIHRIKGDIQPPLGAKDIIGEDYRIIMSDFQDASFANITTQTYDDLLPGNFVVHISIDGDSEFTKTDWFSKDATVCITYGLYEEPVETLIE